MLTINCGRCGNGILVKSFNGTTEKDGLTTGPALQCSHCKQKHSLDATDGRVKKVRS